MSAWETVPVDDPDWPDWDEFEREEWLEETFAELSERAWLGHNRDGWYAKLAGDDECRALGHTEDDFDHEETHPPSWDGDPLCEATRYGECCTECEGTCSNPPPAIPALWSLPGVAGCARCGWLHSGTFGDAVCDLASATDELLEAARAVAPWRVWCVEMLFWLRDRVRRAFA